MRSLGFSFTRIESAIIASLTLSFTSFPSVTTTFECTQKQVNSKEKKKEIDLFFVTFLSLTNSFVTVSN